MNTIGQSPWENVLLDWYIYIFLKVSTRYLSQVNLYIFIKVGANYQYWLSPFALKSDIYF